MGSIDVMGAGASVAAHLGLETAQATEEAAFGVATDMQLVVPSTSIHLRPFWLNEDRIQWTRRFTERNRRHLARLGIVEPSTE